MTATATAAVPVAGPVRVVRHTRPEVVSAVGSHLRTSDGRSVLDACSGAVNVNLGHGHRRVRAAVCEQMERMSFVYRAHFDSPPGRRLRERLTGLTGGAYPGQVFTNSGSEAVEQALRLAWRFHESTDGRDRHVVLTENPGYHGMTLAALAASGHGGRRESTFPGWLAALRPHMQVVHAPDLPGGRAGAGAWRAAIERAGSALAAVIVEPVGGASSGAAATGPATLAEIRRAASSAGALVISDEVMTGFGRLGSWCPSADRGLAPDMVVVSKGLGAGYHPIGAVLLDRTVAAVLHGLPDGGTFGHTMAGSPVAAATANAVLDEIESADLLAHVRDTGPLLGGLLRQVAAGQQCLGSPRGEGYLFAVPVHRRSRHDEHGGGACASETRRGTSGGLLGTGIDDQLDHDADCLADARAFAACALEEDLLTYPAGVNCSSASVLVAPPLNTDPTTLHDLADRLAAAAHRFERAIP